MSQKSKILIQFDSDRHASVFDSVVAIDSGIDHLLTHANVKPEDIESLVHGAMFTRGSKDLCHTALFFGGNNVAATEELVRATKKCFFGNLRVSLLSDPNGSNTTAAAAVLCAQNETDLGGKNITILGGTGPVGQRIARLIGGVASAANPPAAIRLGSRSLKKSEGVCDSLAELTGYKFSPSETSSDESTRESIRDADIVFAAGAAGIELMTKGWISNAPAPAVAIDLNAVPPAGIFGVSVTDQGEKRNNTVCYGAIGVGGLKMKIHKQAIKNLFHTNDLTLETEETYRLGVELIK
ncbi:MAG: NADP-dependent methylenetetrahydromethanopterin/methylenetetrahydrofolate dehydrogenase [Mariniblastus sp.]|nr:NADP-dependent methylenetetrahydromethanopterin/methylenetetrahydrofolate dehydrogenase [Mariniblastus sp.]